MTVLGGWGIRFNPPPPHPPTRSCTCGCYSPHVGYVETDMPTETIADMHTEADQVTYTVTDTVTVTVTDPNEDTN